MLQCPVACDMTITEDFVDLKKVSNHYYYNNRYRSHSHNFNKSMVIKNCKLFFFLSQFNLKNEIKSFA